MYNNNLLHLPTNVAEKFMDLWTGLVVFVNSEISHKFSLLLSMDVSV